MIDFGLSKLTLIAVVALIVIGPEKLPKLARTVGALLNRAQRYVSDVKAEVSRQIELDEMNKVAKSVSSASTELQQSVQDQWQEVQRQVQEYKEQTEQGANDSLTSEQATASADPAAAWTAPSYQPRKRKKASNAIPLWYQRQTRQRRFALSGAARVARYRPKVRG